MKQKCVGSMYILLHSYAIMSYSPKEQQTVLSKVFDWRLQMELTWGKMPADFVMRTDHC